MSIAAPTESIIRRLSSRVREAMDRASVRGDPLMRLSQDDRFGDYQSNCAMSLARKLGREPRAPAADIIEQLDVDDMCEQPEIAGPGFINFRLKSKFLSKSLRDIPACADREDDRVGIGRTSDPQTVVVDLSSPNLAKEMHVGHLRSAVIGDCVARVLEFEGHTVIRENHVGDWGTQFGMLVAHLRSTRPDVIDRPGDLVIGDLESFYVEAKARFDRDDEFRTESRDTVVKLQRGDPVVRRIWKAFCDESLRHCHAICDRLGVELIDRGESFYTELMEGIVVRLEEMREPGDAGLVRISEGAMCMFPDGFKTRDGNPLPLIVRKSDGGFNYATSDLATIVHRERSLGATRIVYVVGLTQKQHFEMLFSAARMAGFASESTSLEHLGFGSILADDGRPFKTRDGGTVKLKDLMDEAVARAKLVVERGDRGLTTAQADAIAERVGMAAIKYFDLSHALNTDYRFNPDTMLSLEGNTAPYMMYAYARIRSICRKASVDLATLPADTPIVLKHPAELGLAKALLRFPETVDAVAGDLKPIVLTDYLYGLSKSFSRFYDKRLGVRVIDASPKEIRVSRLRLCDLTARVLRVGLWLLGIETVEQM